MSDNEAVFVFLDTIKTAVDADERMLFDDVREKFLAAADPNSVYGRKAINQIGPACDSITAFFVNHMIKSDRELKEDVSKLGNSPGMHDYWTLYSFAKYWEKDIALYMSLFDLKKCYNLNHHSKAPKSEGKEEKKDTYYTIPKLKDGRFRTYFGEFGVKRITTKQKSVDKEFLSFAKTTEAALKYLKVTYEYLVAVLEKCGYTTVENIPIWIEPKHPTINMKAEIKDAIKDAISEPLQRFDQFEVEQSFEAGIGNEDEGREGHVEEKPIDVTETPDESASGSNLPEGKKGKKIIAICILIIAFLAGLYSIYKSSETTILEELYLSDSSGKSSGDNYGGREFYKKEEVNSDILGNELTLNSIIDSDIGDERNFVGARHSTSNNGKWEPDTITVKDGDVCTICMFVKNDNPNGINAVATDVNALYSIPANVDTEHWVIGYIDCSNARPTRYWDGVKIVSDEPVYIEFIEDSARFYNSEMDGLTLSNDIIAEGVPLGFDRFDGNIPGGDKYQGLVTIDVKIHKSVTTKLSVKLRLDGTDSWSEYVYANVGDTVEYQIEYKNLTNDKVEDIMIRDILPTNTAFINGSTYLSNNKYPEGILLQGKGVVSSGVDIGEYGPNESAIVRFKVKIVDNSLSKNNYQLVNWANATIWETDEEYDLYKDDASVFVISN